ncbi:MAG: hypothetical protein HXX17_13485 [Geobacteraceae bacterium]|nr:hypothetical protein [Geobacteraceae bacterium]
MDNKPIDEAIERYVSERRVKGKDEAGARFLSYVRIRYHGSELIEFLGATTNMIRYYIGFFRMLVNPLKGPELAFFATALAMGIFGCLMLTEPEEQLPGIIMLSGALVNGWSIISRVLRKWCDLNVLIAIYQELLVLAEKEMLEENCGRV